MRIFGVIKNIPKDYYNTENVINEFFERENTIIYNNSSFQQSFTFSSTLEEYKTIKETISRLMNILYEHSKSVYFFGIVYDEFHLDYFIEGYFYKKYYKTSENYKDDIIIKRDYEKNIKYFEDNLSQMESELLSDYKKRRVQKPTKNNIKLL